MAAFSLFTNDSFKVKNRIQRGFRKSKADGFRVLAVATRKLDKRAAYSKADESDLVLTGYLAFLDPPKDTATAAIRWATRMRSRPSTAASPSSSTA